MTRHERAHLTGKTSKRVRLSLYGAVLSGDTVTCEAYCLHAPLSRLKALRWQDHTFAVPELDFVGTVVFEPLTLRILR